MVQISGYSDWFLDMGNDFGIASTSKLFDGRGASSGFSCVDPFLADETSMMGDRTIAASFLFSRNKRLLTESSTKPMRSFVWRPAAAATAKRLAAITPPSQNQCRYDLARYFQAFRQASEVK